MEYTREYTLWGMTTLQTEYTEAELAAWAARINAQPWTTAYVFFKHEESGIGAKLALQFADMVE